ncbi:hypothetical protein B0T17DRAFT_538664 [Bombardia bombarda]|uniref:Uncharacterized protein n=1 Tax=Bombardia bombarda TaxID=252184 RepID=A0AA40BVY8_9PEZI|nr:hypothetical protein B0T17DRAFT_538664 [Bombardia bombarda]
MPTTTANINNLDLDQTTPGPYIDTWLAGQAGLGIVNEISNKWEESDMEISPIIASSTEDEESISRNRKTETNAHDIRIHPRTRLELEFCLPGQKIATTTARAVSTSALAIAKTQEATTDHPPRGRTRHPQQPRHVSAHGLEHQHKRNLPPLQATAAANTAEDRGKVRHHHHHPTSIFPDPSMPSSRAPIMASSNNNTSGTRSVSEPMAASFSARGTGAAASAGPTMPPPAPPLRRWIRQSSGAAAFVPSIIPEEDAAAAASSSRSVGRGGGGDGAAPESWPAHARTASSTGRQRASEQGAACRTGGGDDDGRADAGPRGLRVREMVERVEAKGK